MRNLIVFLIFIVLLSCSNDNSEDLSLSPWTKKYFVENPNVYKKKIIAGFFYEGKAALPLS